MLRFSLGFSEFVALQPGQSLRAIRELTGELAVQRFTQDLADLAAGGDAADLHHVAAGEEGHCGTLGGGLV